MGENGFMRVSCKIAKKERGRKSHVSQTTGKERIPRGEGAAYPKIRETGGGTGRRPIETPGGTVIPQ